MEIDVTTKARVYATAAHGAINQRRKYTNEPYIIHPQCVVNIPNTIKPSPNMVAAAWLHDVVEDTEITIDDIDREFGMTVAAMVEQLTDYLTPADGNRRTRKSAYLEKISASSPEVKTIKLADLIDNSIGVHGHEFYPVYLQEKRALLQVLTEGDSTLYHIAQVMAVDRPEEVERVKIWYKQFIYPEGAAHG